MSKFKDSTKGAAVNVVNCADDYEEVSALLDNYSSEDLKAVNDLFLVAISRCQAAYDRKNPVKRERKKVERKPRKTLKDFLSEEASVETENDKIWS